MRVRLLGCIAVIAGCGADGGAEATDDAGSDGADESVDEASVGDGPGDESGGCQPVEACNGVDDDCDGTIDEDCSGCLPGDTQPCYDAPDDTLDVGACRAGVQTCVGGGWQACEGQVEPTAEACNDVDDDCDGLVDDACGGWTVEIGNTHEGATGVAIDGEGNVVLTGAVLGVTDFGGGDSEGFGDDDAFVAKYASDGTYLWARRIGGPGHDVGRAVAVAASGDVWVVGDVGADADLGMGPMPGLGADDGFVVRLDHKGQPLGSRLVGSADSDSATGVSIDGEGRAVVVGEMHGLGSFGGTELDGTTGRTVVAQYTADGAHVWSIHGGSGDYESDQPRAVVVEADGDVYVAGSFEGVGTYGDASFDASGGEDIFLWKLDATGVHQWAQKFGDSVFLDVMAYALALAPDGNVVMTGHAEGAVDFGGGATSGGELFVATFTPDGAHVWSRRTTGEQENWAYGRGVAVGADGTVVVCGYYDQRVALGTVELSVSDESDVLVFALSADGEPLWGERMPGPLEDEHDYGHAAAAGPGGMFAVAGAFRTSAFARVFGTP